MSTAVPGQDATVTVMSSMNTTPYSEVIPHQSPSAMVLNVASPGCGGDLLAVDG